MDIETNGFLSKKDLVIHCICFKDIETKQSYSFNPDTLNDALQLLKKATLIVGHNAQGFDIPVLLKVLGFDYKGEVFDTLLVSRLIYTNILDNDFKFKELPAKLYGRHSLEAWGYRLGLRKGDYQEHSDFTEFNQDMLRYCERDVEVTFLLYERLQKENYSKQAIELEHQFAHWIRKQEQHGVYFDEKTAQSLHSILVKRRLQIEDELSVVFPSWKKYVGTKVYKRDNKKKGIKAGVPVKQYKTEIFNPSSRDHIADRLITLFGWKPKSFTPTGKPEVNEKILNSLPYPEAKKLSEYLMIQKRLGQLSDGEQSYLKLLKGEKIYGQVITNGAVTGRCTHHSPNLAQCVASGSPYGKEFRSLFNTTSDMDFIGLDFSGLELRVLAHYLHNYDNGNFQRTLLEDDIHTANQKATGLPTRNKAKTFIYAFIYGCGDKKLSEILDVSFEEAKRVRLKFNKNLPALAMLISAVRRKFLDLGYLKGLDGRRLICRAEYSALNTLIQSAGALLVKQGTIILNKKLNDAGFVWGTDYAMVLHIHDEMQFNVTKTRTKEFMEIAKSIFTETKDYFNFRCPLDGEIKVGRNWSDTH